jgi:hypothetical protein
MPSEKMRLLTAYGGAECEPQHRRMRQQLARRVARQDRGECVRLPLRFLPSLSHAESADVSY